jgi:predicted PurR-regulated permease PerM
MTGTDDIADRRFRARTLFAISVLLAGAALLAFAWMLRTLLLLTLLAILLAVVLRAAADLIHDGIGIGRRWAVILLALVLVVGVVLAGWWLAPTVAEQVRGLVQRVPEAAEALQQQIGDQPRIADLWSQVSSGLSLPDPEAAMGQAGRILAGLSSSLGYIGLVLVGALYLALEPDLYRRGAIRLVPVRHRPFADDLLRDLEQTVRSWLGGQLVLMAFIGVLTGLGLWAIGIPYWLALGILAGLLEFVPYLGPILSAVPVVLIALTGGPSLVLWALAVLIGVQQVENNILQPLIQKSAVDIPPVLLLVTLFAAGGLFGLPGLLVATPLLAIGIVLVRRIYVERTLEGGGDTTRAA